MIVYLDDNRTVIAYNKYIPEDLVGNYTDGVSAVWIDTDIMPDCEDGYEIYLDTDNTLQVRLCEPKPKPITQLDRIEANTQSILTNESALDVLLGVANNE